VAAEKMLVNILNRAKSLSLQGENLFASPALSYFLRQAVNKELFTNSNAALEHFANLDDSDLICAIKVWSTHADLVLSTLCRDFTNRRLFKVEVNSELLTDSQMEQRLMQYMTHFNVSRSEAAYFVGDEVVSTDTYSQGDDNINVLLKNGSVRDVADVSDMLNIQVLTKKVEKHFFCHYKIR